MTQRGWFSDCQLTNVNLMLESVDSVAPVIIAGAVTWSPAPLMLSPAQVPRGQVRQNQFIILRSSQLVHNYSCNCNLMLYHERICTVIKQWQNYQVSIQLDTIEDIKIKVSWFLLKISLFQNLPLSSVKCLLLNGPSFILLQSIFLVQRTKNISKFVGGGPQSASSAKCGFLWGVDRAEAND